jgi:hypothetical protein
MFFDQLLLIIDIVVVDLCFSDGLVDITVNFLFITSYLGNNYLTRLKESLPYICNNGEMAI